MNPQEYREFESSVLGAVDGYLARGENYILDRRADAYHQWCTRIGLRRRDRESQAAACSQAREYNHALSGAIERFTAALHPAKLEKSSYFERAVKDRRFTGHDFESLIPNDKKQAHDGILVSAVERELRSLLPGKFREFIDSKPWKSYVFALSVDYVHDSVPCLSFSLDPYVVAETEVWLKPGDKTFGAWRFRFPQTAREKPPPGSPLSRVEERRLLGYHYMVIAPAALGRVLWQHIPLTLVRGLAEGDVEPAGTTTIEVSHGGTIYRVDGFDNTVSIPAVFLRFLKEIEGIDGMVSVGILGKRAADITAKRLGEIGAEQAVSPPPGESTADHGDRLPRKKSKKARAYRLFSQGNKPDSPEMKDLGLHKSTPYKYYAAWIADGQPGL